MMVEKIAYRTGDYYGDGSDNLIWEIRDDQGVVAELYVSVERHEITNIWVREDRRREGLARALYETASAHTTLYHAPVGHRSEEGHAFAEAVGGPSLSYPCDCAACSPDEEEI
ncbi:hypothetical protein [Amycolatopsis arida]|uniref:hypothetical protein n=1 Tax=Amycolatopsis arida TaxID=587909 RepID=UPI001066069B|nr:hypothetical protein [Amycolatopsis arida]TDX84937.1 hypothetical protein CLV69_11721 [Amycolatopsis arida]